MAREARRLHCSRCGKSVSSEFHPVVGPDNPDGGLVVRAWVECPECVEANAPEFVLQRVREMAAEVGFGDAYSQAHPEEVIRVLAECNAEKWKAIHELRKKAEGGGGA